MEHRDCVPLVEVTRGNIVESIHQGAFCVVDSRGTMLACERNPALLTYPRSSLKPFQALPFIEIDGDSAFNLAEKEIAIMCASHAGTDKHMAVVRRMQEKIGISEADLQCGSAWPGDAKTHQTMNIKGDQPSPIRHNCSGKHTGMLAHAKMRGYDLGDYLDLKHPVQMTIRKVIGEMAGLEPEDMPSGIDGCSVPVYALPLQNMAQAVARLADPAMLDPVRKAACSRITSAMMNNPDMISGEGRFDTELMSVVPGKVFSKGGAEGFHIAGIMPGVVREGSPGIGIAIKIADGDRKFRARSCVLVKILLALGVLDEDDLRQIPTFGFSPIHNARKMVVGQVRPCISINL